jgi:antibiotic biosynthesis monooxygenase (ABM) superfamily enzyme
MPVSDRGGLDTATDAAAATASAATVIIGQKVRDGLADEFQRWQNDVNCAAGDYPGFLGAEVTAPTAVQPDWVVVYRFDSVVHLRNWLNSSTRQEYLDRGAHLFDGPATQQVLTGGSKVDDPLVTVVVTHRVNPELVDEFLAWQQRAAQVEGTFEGFRGTELFRPIEGVQDEWTALYRFDTAAHLDAWLTSDKRATLLAEGERFSDFELRTVDNSFGSWFAFDERGNEAPPPSEIKSAIAVWVGLYPCVVLLSLLLSPLKMPLWLGLLVGNLLSSLVMSFFVMPRYVNPALGWWLRPKADAPADTNLKGIGLVLALNGFWLVVFYLVTVQFWTLP